MCLRRKATVSGHSARATVAKLLLISGCLIVGAGCSLIPDSAGSSDPAVDERSQTETSTEAASTTSTTAKTTSTTVETTSTNSAADQSTTVTTIAEGDTTAESTAETTVAGSADGVSDQAATTTDAEPGLRYDLGRVVEFEETDDGVVVVFDRYQLPDGTFGPTLADEPSIVGASDVGFVNENPKLRRYPVAAGAATLIADPAWLEMTCAGEAAGAPRYVEGVLIDLLPTLPTVSLTFDSGGHVIVVRDQSGC